MLRQVMFSLVGGGLLGWGLSLAILKSAWLTQAMIRFLRIGMWIPFLVVVAIHDTFRLGIAASALAAIHHNLVVRSCLGFSTREAFPIAAGEVVFQALFFSFLGQVWSQRWNWMIFGLYGNPITGIMIFGVVVALVWFINVTFRRSFLAWCETSKRVRESLGVRGDSLRDMILLTAGWLFSWHLTCAIFGYQAFYPLAALQTAGELLFAQSTWSEILTSLLAVLGGIVLGSLFAITLLSAMVRSSVAAKAVIKILPAMLLSPFVAWILAFFVIYPVGANSDWQGFRTFFLGVGHKIMGVGFGTFYPLIQELWAFRDTPQWQRWLIAVDGALPVAFVAMCFGEMYAATAGVSFQMVIASATSQYQQGLAWFFITLALFAGLSTIVRFGARRFEPLKR